MAAPRAPVAAASTSNAMSGALGALGGTLGFLLCLSAIGALGLFACAIAIAAYTSLFHTFISVLLMRHASIQFYFVSREISRRLQAIFGVHCFRWQRCCASSTRTYAFLCFCFLHHGQAYALLLEKTMSSTLNNTFPFSSSFFFLLLLSFYFSRLLHISLKIMYLPAQEHERQNKQQPFPFFWFCFHFNKTWKCMTHRRRR
jgi:hypothetical protein